MRHVMTDMGWARLLVGGILVCSACNDEVESGTSPPVVVEAAPAPKPPEPAPTQAQQARDILVSACGNCHVSGRSEQPAALNIFDLAEPDWVARVSDEQLEGFVARLEDMGLPKSDADIVIGYISRTLADRRSTDVAPEDCA